MDNVNCVVPLLETRIDIFSSDSANWLTMPAKVTMRLLPTPAVYIEVESHDLECMYIKSQLRGREPELKLRLSSGPEIEVFMRGCNVLVPVQEPVSVLQTSNNLRSVGFHLINFPFLAQEENCALLKAGPWQVEIKPRPELSEIKKVLQAESGYGLTHEGILQRTDGESFTTEKADKFLDVFYQFLSFVRGGNCGVTLITGSDVNGEKAWEKWGAYSSYPWLPLSSWLHRRHNNVDTLSSVFQGFWEKLGQTTDDAIRIALSWYLRSNESYEHPYIGIILTQAALARLANQILQLSEYESLKKQKKKIEEKMIRAVLQLLKIECSIPESLQNLKEMSLQSDGPAILTQLRNDLVHPEMNRENVSPEAYFEAWHLGQWYVELFLLKFFGYAGKYNNRIGFLDGSIGHPKNVPWVQHLEVAE